MLKRIRYSPIHRALTWLVLCTWLTLVGATAVHHHPVPRSAAQGSSAFAAQRASSSRSFHVAAFVAAEHEDDCGVCKWLCAMGHALLTSPLRLSLERAAMPHHPLARPPTSPVLAFASASRGPPASLLLFRANLPFQG